MTTDFQGVLLLELLGLQPVLKPLAKLEYLIIYTDTESMTVHLINRTLFFKEYKNTSDRIEIYDSVQFCIAIICEKH